MAGFVSRPLSRMGTPVLVKGVDVMTRLGGTCGIPRYDRRVYVKVSCAVDSTGAVRPTERWTWW